MTKFFTAVACVAILSATAFAEDSWTETVTFSRGDTAAIKVFEPEGYTASVTINGETQREEVPTVLRVPDGDAFIVVTMVAPNGAKWAKKIETKKGKISELRVKHASSAGRPAAAKRKFFGKFVVSTKSPCAQDNSSSRIDFVDASGATAATFTAPQNGKGFTGEVPEGDFTVRTFRIDPDGTATYRNTRQASIKADGWVGTLFCSAKGGGVDIQFSAR